MIPIQLILFRKLQELSNLLKSCNPKPRIESCSLHFYTQMVNLCRPIENLIFIQKADFYNKQNIGVARIDLGVRMDAKAVLVQGYFQRLHHDQPMFFLRA